VSDQAWWRRFLVRGVFWRQFLRWAVLNIPVWIEPIVMAWWSCFFLLWGPGRRGVMHNLAAIKPGSWALVNFFRTLRVFWNYAWTITDNVRFQELKTIPDWEFVGEEHFRALQSSAGGAIILTAHMGSYDLGAQLFSTHTHRNIVMVRAPELDPDTRHYEESMHERLVENVRIDFNTRASELALELFDAVRQGNIIAIQGDRVTPGISALPATLFGRAIQLPAGPFALAMAAGVPIYPLFVMRAGRRRYRLVTSQPFSVVRRSRNRNEDFGVAMKVWTDELERAIADYWFQWFAFEPYSPEVVR
jgi:KDO2-lipid IV(A) lauroyltransferase